MCFLASEQAVLVIDDPVGRGCGDGERKDEKFVGRLEDGFVVSSRLVLMGSTDEVVRYRALTPLNHDKDSGEHVQAFEHRDTTVMRT